MMLSARSLTAPLTLQTLPLIANIAGLAHLLKPWFGCSLTLRGALYIKMHPLFRATARRGRNGRISQEMAKEQMQGFRRRVGKHT